MALLGVMVMMCGCGREELKWEPDFKTGMKTAQEQGLAALIYFTGEGWCPQCKILDEKVLSGDERKRTRDHQVELPGGDEKREPRGG